MIAGTCGVPSRGERNSPDHSAVRPSTKLTYSVLVDAGGEVTARRFSEHAPAAAATRAHVVVRSRVHADWRERGITIRIHAHSLPLLPPSLARRRFVVPLIAGPSHRELFRGFFPVLARARTRARAHVATRAGVCCCRCCCCCMSRGVRCSRDKCRPRLRSLHAAEDGEHDVSDKRAG